MDILQSFTCLVLALFAFAVFRREILKVRDVVVRFWVPKKRRKVTEDKKKLRHESNKENLAPIVSEPPPKMSQPETLTTTKETFALTDKTTKITEETEGLRIQSATLLDDIPALLENKFDMDFRDNRQENLEETKPVNTGSTTIDEIQKNVQEIKTEMDTFPLFADIFASPPTPISTSSKSEEVSQDDRNYEKTTKETAHEVKGNTETTFFKEEHKSVKSNGLLNGLPGITVDTIDLNKLISDTQKKLDSFKDGFKTDVASSTSSVHEVKKTEVTTKTESKSSILSSDLFSTGELKDIFPCFATDVKKTDSPKKIPPPTLPKPKIRPLSDSFMQTLKDFEMELEGKTGGLVGSDTESSYLTSDSPFGTTMLTRKKKMFSSSSFYEEPHAIYPTVEEQVEMARKIADSLADDTNKKSKGANMFFKRVKRSTKWIHEGPEPSDDSESGTPEILGEPPTPDPSVVPWKSHQKGLPSLKLVLDPRHTQDASTLRSSGFIISEHNVVSPQVCHGLVKDLHSPVGKGAALFAKRKKKSEEWVVDEEKVKALMREQQRKSTAVPPAPQLYQQFTGLHRQEVKLKSPWEAAMESPYGNCDSAFGRVRPDELADTVIKAADYKRTWEPPPPRESCISPPVTPAAAFYDIYHAKAPKGWTTPSTVMPSVPAPIHSAPTPINASQDVSNPYQTPKKMVFQNFNAIPRLWKGASTV